MLLFLIKIIILKNLVCKNLMTSIIRNYTNFKLNAVNFSLLLLTTFLNKKIRKIKVSSLMTFLNYFHLVVIANIGIDLNYKIFDYQISTLINVPVVND